MLDTRTGAVQRTIAVANAPVAIGVDQRASHAFVVSLGPINQGGGPIGAGQVSVLDTRTGAVVRIVPVGMSPCAVAVAATTGRVFVLNGGANSVVMLDARSGAILRRTGLGGALCQSAYDLPVTVAVDERTRRVFVASAAGVSILDARSGALLRTVRVPGTPFATAVDGRTGHAFVLTPDTGSVSMLDTRTGIILRTVKVGGAPLAVAVDARLGRLFVLGTDGGLHALLDHAAPHQFPWPDDTLSVLDTRSGDILRTIKVGDPHAIAVDDDTGRAFVANRYKGTISVLDAAH